MANANPFNLIGSLAGWLHNHGNGGHDISAEVKLGDFNFLTHHDALPNSYPTTIANVAEQNATLVVENQSHGAGSIGVYGESDGDAANDARPDTGGSIGVAGSANGWGVAGVSTENPVDVLNNNDANNATYPEDVGVFGAGDQFGVYGQCLPNLNPPQGPTGRPVTSNTGVFGIGEHVGVEGDNISTDPEGTAVGTGIIGLSVQGIGVWGVSQGDPVDADPPIYPYIGVYGQAQVINHADSPYPVDPDSDYYATGVFGVADVRGGVFQATPQDGDETYANVQLTPLKIQERKQEVSPAPTGGFTPELPPQGMAGDIIAVDVQIADRGSDPAGIQLWLCIKSAPTGTGGATWARISFDAVVTAT